jgi:hypothetical protein
MEVKIPSRAWVLTRVHYACSGMHLLLTIAGPFRALELLQRQPAPICAMRHRDVGTFPPPRPKRRHSRELRARRKRSRSVPSPPHPAAKARRGRMELHRRSERSMCHSLNRAQPATGPRDCRRAESWPAWIVPFVLIRVIIQTECPIARRRSTICVRKTAVCS